MDNLLLMIQKMHQSLGLILDNQVTMKENQIRIEKKVDSILNKAGFTNQEWFSLKEACEWKGIKYTSISGKPEYQPNFGVPDGYQCKGRRWTRATILKWLNISDEDLLCA